MSPLWRDEVAIYLAPRKVALARRERGVRPRVSASTEVAVPGGAFHDFAPALARLAEVLAEETWHDAVARVVVADPWARYGVVPSPATRLDAAGRLAHARYVLADAYGEAVSEWAVTLDDSPPGRAYVACAMPASLRSGIEDALAPAGLALASLRPQLIVTFNAWRHRLPADDAWFVSVDDGTLAAVHLKDGAWDRVHMARLSSNWTVELERLRAFGRITRATGALGAGRMFVDAPSWMRQAAAPVEGMEWLEEGAEDGGEAHALALLQRVYA